MSRGLSSLLVLISFMNQCECPVESKSQFTNENPLRGYDNRKEDWPKCMHGEDCLLQMCTEGM
jgi:hypothetical protein